MFYFFLCYWFRSWAFIFSITNNCLLCLLLLPHFVLSSRPMEEDVSYFALRSLSAFFRLFKIGFLYIFLQCHIICWILSIRQLDALENRLIPFNFFILDLKFLFVVVMISVLLPMELFSLVIARTSLVFLFTNKPSFIGFPGFILLLLFYFG